MGCLSLGRRNWCRRDAAPSLLQHLPAPPGPPLLPQHPLRAPHTLCRAGRPCPPAATPPARCLRAALARAHFPVLQHHLAAGGRKAPPAQQHGGVEREGTAVWIAAATRGKTGRAIAERLLRDGESWPLASPTKSSASTGV